MEKITSCHLSFFVVKHVSLFVTKSIFAPFHGFLCSAPSFCPFRDLFVCFMLLPFSHCEGLATLLWQMWQQKNKNTVVYARVRACVAYAPICARTNRSTSQKKKVHFEEGTSQARVRGYDADKGERMLRKQERETVWANAGGGAWGPLNSCAFTLERKNKSDEQLSFLPTLVRILTEIKSLSSLFRDFFTLWGDMWVYTYRGCRHCPLLNPIHGESQSNIYTDMFPNTWSKTILLTSANKLLHCFERNLPRLPSFRVESGENPSSTQWQWTGTKNTKVRPNKCFGTP